MSTSTAHAWWAARDHLDHTYAPPPRPEDEPEAETRRDTFTDYFSTESLFTSGPTGPAEAKSQSPPAEETGWWEGADPYDVLGVDQAATWEEISAAHRRLAKLHHPDRLLHAAADDRERSERRMRELNIAYSELRRRRGR